MILTIFPRLLFIYLMKITLCKKLLVLNKNKCYTFNIRIILNKVNPMYPHEQTENTKELKARVEAFKALCRSRSLRVTEQRLEIFRTLAQSKAHPSAEAVFAAVRKKLPNISLDTVYRTLASMEEAGVVFRVGLSTKARFDADLTPHYHFVCMDCGEVYDVFPQPGAPSLLVPQDINRFGEVKNANLQFRGICNRCRAAAGKEK